MKNIEKSALLEYSDLVLDGKEKEEIIYNCYDGKCIYNGKTLNVKGDMPDRGRIIVNEDGATFENIIIKGYNCIKENNKFTCNNTGLTKVNGTSILIDNNKTTVIENYRIYGNSIQNGTPTPDTPVEVESVGELVTLDNCSSYGEDACNNVGKYVIPIKVTGKNLFDLKSVTLFNASINDGSIVSDADSKLFNADIYLKAGTYTISLSKDFDDSSIYFRKGKIQEGYFLKYNNTQETYTFTYDKDEYLRLSWFKKSSHISNIMLTSGKESNLKYIPYKEAITNIYLDSPLRKVGDYADYIDFKTGKVVRNIKEITLNGSENWIYDSNFNAFKFLNNEFMARQKPISNQLNGIASGILYNDNALLINDDSIYVTKRDLGDDLESFKNGLGQNNLTLINVLKHSLEQTLDLPELLINKDTSVISVNTSILPSNIELEYYR